MTAKTRMFNAFYRFIVSPGENKDKIKELEELVSQAQSTIKIIRGEGITSFSHVVAVLKSHLEKH